MLGALESKLTSKVAEALNGRGVAVVSAPLPIDVAAPGQRRVRVSVDGVSAAPGFEPARTMFSGDMPDVRARRVIHLSFTARIRGTAAPSAMDAQPIAAARQLLMEDLSLVLHALDGTSFRTGDDLDASDDPGYDVLGFSLASGTLRPDLADGAVVGELEYHGTMRLWPPGISEEGTAIRSVESIVETLPVTIRAGQSVVRAGGKTTVSVRVLSRTRRSGTTASPVRVAVTVLGDAPPAERGTLTSGSPSPLAGFTVYDIDKGTATIDYIAPPAGLARPRTEHVTVHIATREGSPGLLLGSAAIRILPAVP